MNIVAILTILVSNMLVYAAPLIFTSIGGAYSEHAGVVNVGLEGIMVMGAFTGVVFNLTFAGSLGGMTIWLSLLAGGLVGLIFSAIHAVATINFRADGIEFVGSCLSRLLGKSHLRKRSNQQYRFIIW